MSDFVVQLAGITPALHTETCCILPSLTGRKMLACVLLKTRARANCDQFLSRPDRGDCLAGLTERRTCPASLAFPRL